MAHYEQLKTGVAYHGNRILRHVEDDMRDIVNHNMNVVVHMFTHNDWDRHKTVVKDIIKISEDFGLEVWVDNWGIGGPPGDKSHFLQYHPEAHQIWSDGTPNPVSSCYNSEAFVQFTKDWLDQVREMGGKKIFWDEPHLKEKDGKFCCCCPTCKKLFAEKYGHEMPMILTPETEAFRAWSIANYFDRVTTYSKELGMENASCVMIHTLEQTNEMLKVSNLTDWGIDPYWSPKKRGKDPYEYVYTQSRDAIANAKSVGKDNHIWIQGYDLPLGHEDDIILATDAAYDAGARNILYWSYRAGESNDYRSTNCDRCWQVMGEACARIRSRHYDAVLEQKRKEFMK
ncbi:MAG: hypothetical protein IJW49_02505 [Clostridia bacterium]|nr:hypothetical protein [Clostridia bacterium]